MGGPRDERSGGRPGRSKDSSSNRVPLRDRDRLIDEIDPAPDDADADDDGLSDAEEAPLSTDLWVADTDGDGLLDGTEVGVGRGDARHRPELRPPTQTPTTVTDPHRRRHRRRWPGRRHRGHRSQRPPRSTGDRRHPRRHRRRRGSMTSTRAWWAPIPTIPATMGRPPRGPSAGGIGCRAPGVAAAEGSAAARPGGCASPRSPCDAAGSAVTPCRPHPPCPGAGVTR